MVDAKMIPPEVVEAVTKAFNSWELLSNAECIARALAAWPGAEPHQVLSVRDNGEGYDLKTIGLILPFLRRRVMSDIKMLAQNPVDAWAQGYEQAKQQSADTITALRATNERLRGSLERHVCDCKSNCAWERDETCSSWDARTALAEEKQK